MGESAKLLNPDKHVYIADKGAYCEMVHRAELEKDNKAKKD